MENLKLNNDDCDFETIIDNQANITCPNCNGNDYWYKYYCNTPIYLCSKCGHFEKLNIK